MHYHTFNEAKEKWISRYQRIDYENIIVVLPLINETENVQTYLNAFQKLPHKKVALVTEAYVGQPNTFAYTKEMYDPDSGKNLLSCRKNNKFFQWRCLDYFDYGTFLRSGEIKARKL